MDDEVNKLINNCRDLQSPKLDLSYCNLTHIPDEVFMLTHLEVLILAENQLSTLPESIGKLQKLQKLYLPYNQINKLPEAISQLCFLRVLYLGNNQLDTLPDTIPSLPNLQILSLDGNQLRMLPETLAQLQSLRELYLRNNLLNTLPEAVVRISGLEILLLDDNPLGTLPLEIKEQGLEAIRNYLREITDRLAQVDYLYEAKILLVGEGRVGKTSLAKSLSIPNYVLEDEESTEGINVQTWYIRSQEANLKKDLRLNIWDFGGQEIYHATHQFFLTKRSLYLLVTESLREDKHEDFYYWLNIIRLLSEDSPVIIVLNKCDQSTKELPINEYQKFFENIVSYIKVSCCPDYRDTIAALKTEIGRILTNKALLPHIGSELPRVWVDIREEIAQLRESGLNYMSYEEYLKLCQQYDMNEERALFLSNFFHDLGVFLYFRDDLSLCDTVFLNYEWVTDGVYKVLDNEQVKAKYGHFDDNDLIDIWHGEKYRGKRKELLALMKSRKFELCYDLSEGGYLAPQLLPVDEILFNWYPDQYDLHFEYRYHFMPKGILSRFIVKRHHDIFRQAHWRYGVVLEWDGTRALVREHYFERKLTIVLTGRNQKGFLEIIRKTIEEIHSSFNNLVVQEMIPCNCYECRTSQKPHFFRYELLERYQRAGKRKITCENSLLEMDVCKLISDVFLPGFRDEEEIDHRHELHVHGDYYEQRISTSGGSIITGEVTTGGGAFTGRDQIT